MKKFLFWLIILLQPLIAQARHIVGGEITYRFVSKSGNFNRYEFTLKVYRDCDPTKGGAPLDPTIMIGVFRSTSGRLQETFFATLTSSRRVAAPQLECLIPPDICVEEGVYVFTKDLPLIDEPYLILWQRCCRNRSIVNIRNPETVGATYTVEITPAAQIAGNSSPTFKTFPPTVICANEKLNYDHSGIDPEGDSLVYQFCLPNAGGGNVETRVDCSGPIPQPPCWPVSSAIAFIEPNYTYDKPLGGDPVVSIDRNTGLITGTPNVKGQFVVGVCIEEYRKGVLMSVLRRDFQFNAEECTPTVRAQLNADTVINNTYIVKSCNDKTITLENTSFERRNITNFYFDIVVEGGIKKYTDWSPVITFPDTGVYNGKLFLNPGTNCGDTLELQMNIFLSLQTDFVATYDTCNGTPVVLEDKSITKNGKILEWKWNVEGQDTLIRNLKYQYLTPGKKLISLSVTDEKECTETVSKEILWYPTPKINIFPVNPIGCTPATFSIKNNTSPIDNSYSFLWTYGDGTKSTDVNPIKTFEKEGLYNLTVDVVTPTGCKATKNYANYFTVKPGTDAEFSYAPTKVTKIENIVNFTDKSKNTDSWNWFYNGKYFSNLANPTYTFRDTGLQTIKLVSLNKYGCTDTIVKIIDVLPIVTYFLPNAFTPNEDGLNDGFKGTGLLDGMRDFTMHIYNRWGEMIFETNDPTETWNGRKKNQGEPSPEGVYLCIVTYKTARGENGEVRGYVTLVR